jgi:hypothetical protein
VNIITTSQRKFTLIPSGRLLNNTYYQLNSILPPTGYIVNATLTVNGTNYQLDDWVDTLGNTRTGFAGTSGTLSGFSINYSLNPSTIGVKWNYIIQQPKGYNLANRDKIVFSYTE